MTDVLGNALQPNDLVIDPAGKVFSLSETPSMSQREMVVYACHVRKTSTGFVRIPERYLVLHLPWALKVTLEQAQSDDHTRRSLWRMAFTGSTSEQRIEAEIAERRATMTRLRAARGVAELTQAV